jgi:hypothetical protein
MSQTHELWRLRRLLSDAWRSGDQSPLEESCSGILPRPTLSPSAIRRPQRSMSIGVCLECLTLDYGPRGSGPLLARSDLAKKSVGRLGDNLLIWRGRHRNAIVQAVSPVLTDRTLQEPPTYGLHTYGVGPCRSHSPRLGFAARRRDPRARRCGGRVLGRHRGRRPVRDLNPGSRRAPGPNRASARSVTR